MGHPNKALPDTKGTRVMYTVHPQAEKPVKEKKLTKGGKLSYDERLDRVLRLVEIYVLSQSQGKAVYQLAGIPDLDIDGSGNIRVTKDTLLKEMKKFRDEGRKNHSE
jgi:hypothetical protein